MEWWFWKWLGEGWITMLYVASEIYFPHWIYKRLELNQEPRLRSIKNESDKEMVRKLIIVSLWCIQTDPSNRPAMSRVVDMMEGSMESLQIPPKPYLSIFTSQISPKTLGSQHLHISHYVSFWELIIFITYKPTRVRAYCFLVYTHFCNHGFKPEK